MCCFKMAARRSRRAPTLAKTAALASARSASAVQVTREKPAKMVNFNLPFIFFINQMI